MPRTRGAAAAARALAGAVERLGRDAARRALPQGADPGGRSRGALLRLAPAVNLAPVAAVDADRCIGFSRCGACADACPAGAIGAGEGTAPVATADCTACGRCLGVCPAGAIRLAGCSGGQIEAQLAAVLADGAADVLFACTGALGGLDDERGLDDWALVEVPALAMVTPGWIAQTLLAGAAHVWLRPCGGDCCAAWREQGARADLTQRLLGARAEEFAVAEAAPVPARAGARRASRRPVLSEPAATVAALAELDSRLQMPHSASPLGLLDITAGCTTCGACTVVCPTGALALAEEDAAVTVRHDPRLCTGCDLCSRACPEHVLHVERGLDAGRLAGGPFELASAAVRRCRGCGERMPAAAVAARNHALLVDRWPQLGDGAADLCLACSCSEAARVPTARL